MSFSLLLSLINGQSNNLDVNNSFLNGILYEKVYMEQPQRFVSSNPSPVYKLHKPHYGLKQAPRKWFERHQISLLNLQFKEIKWDSSLFTYFSNGHTIYLIVYVDGIILKGSSKALLKDNMTKLNLAFSLKYLGDLDYFLSIEVKQASHFSLLLSKPKYIRDFIRKINMTKSCPVNTHMQSTCKLTKTRSIALPNPFLYTSVVSAL